MKEVKFIRRGNRIYWKPAKFSHWIYWARYWIGYSIMPAYYRLILKEFNQLLFERQWKEGLPFNNEYLN